MTEVKNVGVRWEELRLDPSRLHTYVNYMDTKTER